MTSKFHELGEVCKTKHFVHHSNLTRVNNGSYGAIPTCVLAAQEKLRTKWLQSPDQFFEQDHPTLMLSARHGIADLVHTKPSQITLLDNATTAASAVAKALALRWKSGEWIQGDKVLMCSLTYESTQHGFSHYCGNEGARIDSVVLPVPVTSSQDVIDAYSNYLTNARGGPPIRAAVLDHIHSKSAYVMPIQKLATLLRSFGVEYIYVDGAHTPGQLDVHVDDLGVDSYCGNLHKWAFTPTGTAFLWASEISMENKLHHPIVSNSYGKGFAAEGSYVGTKDYSCFWAIQTALEFARACGGFDTIQRYCHSLVLHAAHMLAFSWKTGIGQPEEMTAHMMLVGLPPALGTTLAHGAALRDKLMARNIQIQYPTTATHGEFSLYVRISAAIYNSVGDYVILRDAVNEITRDALTPSKM